MILIDKRSGSYDLCDHLSPEVVKLTHLDAADAAFLGNGPDGDLTLPIGIEVKAFGDLIDSLLTGRLVGEQLPKLSAAYKLVYIVVEGPWRCGESGSIEIPKWINRNARTHAVEWKSLERKLTFRQLDNWLNNISTVGRVTIKRSYDRYETAQQILNLYLAWSKPYDSHATLHKFDESQQPLSLIKPSLKRRVAAELPGIGWKRSELVATHFPTVQALVNAGVDEWETIPGIGPKTAKKVVEALVCAKPNRRAR